MIYHHNVEAYKNLLPGIQMKTLVYGEKTLLTEVRMQAGSVLPDHSHPHEQTGYLVSGRMRLITGADVLEAEPGDSWCVPGNATHRAEVLEDTVVVEVFSPVREEYLAYKS